MTAQDLAVAARARRIELGISLPRIASTTGPSLNTVYNIEHARAPRYRRGTLELLDKALGWDIGTAEELLLRNTQPCTCTCHQQRGVKP
jgi:transcriptional regulator with XRE-family HTH domain